MLHKSQFRIGCKLIGASDVRPRLVQSLGAQLLDGVVGFHLLPETLSTPRHIVGYSITSLHFSIGYKSRLLPS